MEKARFCPNCGSTWVEPDTSNRAYVAWGGGNTNSWKCNSCNYTGIMPEGEPEDFEEETENVEFKPDEEYPREDTGFGKAYLLYLFYVMIPILGIYVLYKLLI